MSPHYPLLQSRSHSRKDRLICNRNFVPKISLFVRSRDYNFVVVVVVVVVIIIIIIIIVVVVVVVATANDINDRRATHGRSRRRAQRCKNDVDVAIGCVYSVFFFFFFWWWCDFFFCYCCWRPILVGVHCQKIINSFCPACSK